MRIITWNCCRGKHVAKVPSLLKLEPAIAIIQETPDPAGNDLADGQLWLGTNRNQGLLVLSFNGWRLERVRLAKDCPQFFLPARVKGPEEFNVLAVWGHPIPKTLSGYKQILNIGLRMYENFIKSAPTIFIGDMNWLPEEFIRYGLISCYHVHYNVGFGEEPHATHYFYRQRERVFHYDFCFVPKKWRKRIANVSVGSYEDWMGLSDHCPLIVDLK